MPPTGAAACPVGGLVDQDAAHRGGGLEARGGIDHVAGGDPLSGLRPRAEGDQRLAGGDADAHLDLAQRIRDCQCGPHRALGIVLVRHRRAEQRHHRVADELFHRPAVPLQLRAQPRVHRLDEAAHLLRIHLLGARGEAHHVGEQHRDHLALLARRRRLDGHRRPAVVAEASPGRVLLAAARARGHGPTLRRPRARR
jgi:hypothetical protein